MKPATEKPIRLGGGIAASPFPVLIGIGTAEGLRALDDELARANEARRERITREWP